MPSIVRLRPSSGECDFHSPEILCVPETAEGPPSTKEERPFFKQKPAKPAQLPASFLALASTSSNPPQEKNACSGKWSNSPLHTRSNASIVSLIGTNEPF